MLLHTLPYILFLLVVLKVYWLLPTRVRKPFLLVASYAFYAAFDLRFLVLLIGWTLAVYFLGYAIGRDFHPRRLAWLSVALNLGVLMWFKEVDFFIESVRQASLFLGFQSLSARLQLLLPVGVSFISFQAIAYTTEIYKKKLQPAGILDFAIYMSFFPKLVAGPLVRPDQFLGQLRQPTARLERNAALGALGLFLLGLFKKIIIADSLASLSDVAFRAAAREVGAVFFPSALFWQGFYLYSFLIYADFSGYTDLARASAFLLGFQLPENFRQPYLSENVIVFWNRWHISLTQWFREYLFFPLSRSLLGRIGRRHSRGIQVGVTLLTMLMIGVWHGAAWTFVVWGLWHGALLCIHQGISWKPYNRWQKLGLGVLTFHLVGIGWVLFGSTSLETAGEFFHGMLSFTGPARWETFLPPVLLSAALVFGIDMAQSGSLRLPSPLQSATKPVLVVASLVALVCLVVISQASGGSARPFIYGQF